MLKVGLTGGMACGKSFVAGALRDLGCDVIEADETGHEVMQPGGEAYAPVVAAFGPGILDEQRAIDRPRLAALVFGNPQQLERLNAIVHPAVRRRALRQLAEIGERDPHAIAVYVAAILIESGAWRAVRIAMRSRPRSRSRPSCSRRCWRSGRRRWRSEGSRRKTARTGAPPN